MHVENLEIRMIQFYKFMDIDINFEFRDCDDITL
jgi:hypothetical protein